MFLCFSWPFAYVSPCAESWLKTLPIFYRIVGIFDFLFPEGILRVVWVLVLVAVCVENSGSNILAST